MATALFVVQLELDMMPTIISSIVEKKQAKPWQIEKQKTQTLGSIYKNKNKTIGGSMFTS